MSEKRVPVTISVSQREKDKMTEIANNRGQSRSRMLAAIIGENLESNPAAEALIIVSLIQGIQKSEISKKEKSELLEMVKNLVKVKNGRN